MKLNYLRRLEPVIVVVLLVGVAGTGLPAPFGSLWGDAIKLGTYGFVPLVSLFRWKKIFYVATRDIPILLLTAMAVLSFLWSASPSDTLQYAKALLRNTLFGIYLATCYSPKEQMRQLLWVFGIIMILSLVLGLGMPSFAISDDGLWKGVLGHKNLLARTMTLSALLFACAAIDNPKQRRIRLAGFILAIVLLLLTQGKTALVLLLFGLSLLPLYKVIKQYYKLRVFLLLTVIILGGTLSVWLSVNLETIIVDYLGKDMSMSGRDELWGVLIYRGLQRPWLGYGYAGFWTNLREVSIVNALTWLDLKKGGHAHSGFIDLFLQFGFVGISLFAWSCLTLLARVIQLLFATQAIEYLWLLEFVLITTLSNYSLTSTILDESNIVWLLYVSAALSTALWSERIRRNYHRKELHNNPGLKRGTVDNLPNYQ